MGMHLPQDRTSRQKCRAATLTSRVRILEIPHTKIAMSDSELGASKPVHEPAPKAAVSQPAAFKHETQAGVRPPEHFNMQCDAVHPARSPKHPAQPVLQPSFSMQLVTQDALPKHCVPQVVIWLCQVLWPASASQVFLSVSVHLAASVLNAGALLISMQKSLSPFFAVAVVRVVVVASEAGSADAS